MDARRSSRKLQALASYGRGDLSRYVEAVAAAFVAVSLSWVLRDLLGTRYHLLYAMSLLVAWRNGLRPVLLMSVLAGISWQILVAHIHALALRDAVSISIFVIVSVGMGLAFDGQRDARAQLVRATDGMVDAMLMFDADWKLEYMNESGALLIDRLGVDARELVRRAASDAVETIRDTTFDVESRRAQSEMRVLEYEAQYPNTDLWLHVRCVPTSDRRSAVFVRDITATRKAEHEKQKATERHEAVDNALAVLGVSLDYEWNLSAVTRLLVPTLADYCSVDLTNDTGDIRRVSITHRDAAREELLRTLWQKYPYRAGDPGPATVMKTGELMITRSIPTEAIAAFARNEEHAGMLRELNPRSYLCVPMRQRNQIFGVLSLVYSDSGREYTPEEVAAVEQIGARAATAIENARLYGEAQAGNRAKSDFLATMSHELRTPLNAIAGYADLLAMGVRGPITPEQQRDLSRIRQNQQHLLEIINDILNFSRIEAGRARYDIRSIPLGTVLDRMESVIEPQARARSVTYDYTPSDQALAVLADRERLEQILINLLSNAIKFTQPGGTVNMWAEVDDTRVRIHVRDTGVGIAREQLASIFEPFVQLEPALTRTSEGTGLGLAISRELAKAMNGELTVTSIPGEGSTFTLQLPRDLTLNS